MYRVCARVLMALCGILFFVRGEALSLSIVFVDPPSPPAIPTGHPTKPWTGPEKAVLNQALQEWAAKFRNFDKLGGTWTLRWEDGDLFKNWGAGCDFSTLGAITATPEQFAKCGIPLANFPTNEIYFDVRRPWFVDPTPAFDGDDTGEVPAGQFDLLTTALHEIGHALGILTKGGDGGGHLADGVGGVMEKVISSGERDRISPRDLELIREQGGELARSVIPEPSTLLLLASGLVGLGAVQYKRTKKALPEAAGDVKTCGRFVSYESNVTHYKA
jgi:hypothetical protein